MIGKNVTIQNTVSVNDNGGGIFVANNGTLIVSGESGRVTFINNQSGDGGAIYLSKGSRAKIVGADFFDNKAMNDPSATNRGKEYGGAIYMEDSEDSRLSISHCSFSGNRSTSKDSYGGAIYTQCETTISESVFSANNSSGFAGAIFSSRSLTIQNSEFRNNTAANRGGALYCHSDNSNVKVQRSSFSNNAARGFGGVAYVKAGTANIESTTFSGNSSVWGGGAVWLSKIAKLSIHSSTFDGNKTTTSNVDYGDGGAIYTDSYSYVSSADIEAYENLTIDNATVFRNNRANQFFDRPLNWRDFPNLQSAEQSVSPDGEPSKHVLNNYDVNYKRNPKGKGDVDFEFISADENLTLPDEVNEYLPDPFEMDPSFSYTPDPPEQTQIDTSDGSWVFKGWVPSSTEVVSDKMTTFVGTWEVIPASSEPSEKPTEPSSEPSQNPVEKVVRVTKLWDDNGDQEGLRPSSVTFRLLADGTDTGRTLTLTGENHWSGEFTDLERYDGTKRIVYTIVEDGVAGYDSEIRGDDWSGFSVTNRLLGTPSEPTEPSESIRPTEPTKTTEPTEPSTEPSAQEKYIITYDLAGGEMDGNSGPIRFEVDLGEVITILKAPTRDGFTFGYWKGSAYYPGDSYVVEGDHTFTAVWNESVTKPSSEEPSAQPSEEPTTPPTEPSKPEGTTVEQGLPQTGEEIQGTLWLGFILVMAAGALIILKRRLKNQDVEA